MYPLSLYSVRREGVCMQHGCNREDSGSLQGTLAECPSVEVPIILNQTPKHYCYI